jgi:hypothetical protein
MGTAQSGTFDKAEEVRLHAGLGHSDVVSVGGRPVMRGIYEPGWRWSANVAPIAGGDLCHVRHLGYVVSGRMRLFLSDGEVLDMGPGDVVAIEPGHDAEVLGDETCVFIDFGDVDGFAARA